MGARRPPPSMASADRKYWLVVSLSSGPCTYRLPVRLSTRNLTTVNNVYICTEIYRRLLIVIALALGCVTKTLTPARTPRLGLCHNTLTPARTPRLGLCHNTQTPARTPRLGQCHNTLTPTRTPRLGQCHNTLTPTRTPRLGLCQ